VFRTFQQDLERMRLWLQQCKVTAAVMESTGQYWRPVWELRERTRLRVHLLQDINRVKNRIGQLCETGNVKINPVASDLFGGAGAPAAGGDLPRHRRPERIPGTGCGLLGPQAAGEAGGLDPVVECETG
jgi:hypothetical protein